MVREGNHILQMRRLFQQFLVDVYSKIETERLGFIRREQNNLLADNYDNLRDSFMSTDDERWQRQRNVKYVQIKCDIY